MLRWVEPGFPVEAAECGRRVLVGHDSVLQVRDLNFTRMSIIPPVCFAIIPDSIDLSWYIGRVFIGLNEAIFEPSSLSQHIAELYEMVLTKPNLVVDQTYLKVQLSLISSFLKLDLDFLCVCHTAPCLSRCNPVKQVMSILHLGFLSIGHPHFWHHLLPTAQRQVLQSVFSS